MLFSVDGRQITKLPHKEQFTACRKNLSDADYQRAADSIRSMCEGKDFVVSSFLRGWSPLTILHKNGIMCGACAYLILSTVETIGAVYVFIILQEQDVFPVGTPDFADA